MFYDHSVREVGKASTPSQLFTFMIDESSGDKKPKSQVKIKRTVYQEIKQRNFVS
jgi:hypothetical protein